MLGLAALWAGVPYCPVSPAYSQVSQDLGRLRYVMDLLTPGLVAAFDTPAFERALAAAPGDAEIVGDAQIRRSIGDDVRCARSGAVTAMAQAHEHVGPDTVARFLLTSGSTGQPKAVITTHRMICSNALVLRQALPFLVDEPPVLVDWLPWNHTFGGSHNIGLVLLNGGSLYIDDGKPVPASFGETLRNLREISPTVYFNVPKGFELLAHHLQEDAQLRRTFFARLRAGFFRRHRSPTHVGCSRCGIDARARHEDADAHGPRRDGNRAVGHVHYAGDGTQWCHRSAGRGESGEARAVEDKLEIRVRGPGTTPGYWREPQLTAAAFDEEGYYRMGDAVRLLDEGDPRAASYSTAGSRKISSSRTGRGSASGRCGRCWSRRCRRSLRMWSLRASIAITSAP